MEGVAAARWVDAEDGADLTPQLDLAGFAGSLGFLLRVARAHQVNLSVLPLIDIVEQLAQALERAPAQMPLGQKADWVVMAAWIVLLRSHLLLPADSPAHQDAEIAAGQLRDRLVVLQAAQTLAAWLERCPQLGRDVFARGHEEFPGGFGEIRHSQVDVIAFLWAAMELFDDPQAEPGTAELYRPASPSPYGLPEARLRILRLLAETGAAQTLDRLLPDDVRIAQAHHHRMGERRHRADLSTTFIASLELAKQGDVALEQDEFMSPVSVRALPGRQGELPLPRV